MGSFYICIRVIILHFLKNYILINLGSKFMLKTCERCGGLIGSLYWVYEKQQGVFITVTNCMSTHSFPEPAKPGCHKSTILSPCLSTPHLNTN